ncbi:DUF4142 domain-containing protein [Leptolyngbya sp. FACHB-261]|uniref:DUF4142 domain-containing protein n=1 Tax=Leptolyngbya sp. FACHB-261 TaxID=2692806 RepID=UPI00168292D4|nr:DUF4142 domain-containing protein [Leptolyngbya sp. FACHB-261]MBD2102049.1 DUF4142 domain-containing protein [Leptolyngbya sp. FACHB-261]
MVKLTNIATALVTTGALLALSLPAEAQTSGTSRPSGATTQPGQTNQQPHGSMGGSTGGSMTQPSSTTPQSGRTNRPTAQGLNATDLQFMYLAADGGMAEVQFAQQALRRSSSNEVKQYAQRMIQEHTQANNQLMQIAARKGVTLPRSLSPANQAVLRRLSNLSGAAFDREYMSVAGVASHGVQAALFQGEVQQGQDQDVVAFATRLLPNVQGHLEMARTMANTTVGVNR